MQLFYFHRYEQVSEARVKENKHKLTSPHIDHVFTSKDAHLHNLTSPLAFASVTVAMIVAVPVILEESILKVSWVFFVLTSSSMAMAMSPSMLEDKYPDQVHLHNIGYSTWKVA